MPIAFLDACLIVKDEEANLPRCLASLRRLEPLLQAVHVYDTGSTDRTVAIAWEAGCHVVEGYWDADFSRARNASLAMSEAPWALIVDADDEVQTGAAALESGLRRLAGHDVLVGPIVHVDDTGAARSRTTFVKAVRRDRVEFVGRVHESAVRVDGAETRRAELRGDELQVRHWGYSSAAARQVKGERNLESARADVAAARAAGDLDGLSLALLHEGRSLGLLRRHVEAATSLSEAFAVARPAGPVWCEAAQQLVEALLAQGHVAEATSIVGRVAEEPASAILARVLLASVLSATGDADGAYRSLEAVSDDGDPTHRVDANALAAQRLRLAQAVGRQDEVLARLLVAVGQRGLHELAPSLVAAWGDQPADALATLLRATTPEARLASLRAHLSRVGARGADAARLL